jgi:hypothetical protein
MAHRRGKNAAVWPCCVCLLTTVSRCRRALPCVCSPSGFHILLMMLFTALVFVLGAVFAVTYLHYHHGPTVPWQPPVDDVQGGGPDAPPPATRIRGGRQDVQPMPAGTRHCCGACVLVHHRSAFVCNGVGWRTFDSFASTRCRVPHALPGDALAPYACQVKTSMPV